MPTLTAAQRRELEKIEFDAFMAECKSRELLETLSSKWVALILSALREKGALRYNELARTIAGASQKMLTQTLRGLERDGMVTRTVEPTVPVSVTYGLTPLGASLAELVSSVKTWAESNMVDVIAARAEYDDRA
ncbi:helix-turn-helix domain-containing protein [Nocardioides sp. GY 10127]|uniref:winged helix-turn-helix transcriptional regulator n=1 Tax=Nocardioides sp. GY 10127 TaxID=2569762 RepID=UPI0010A842A9|nr:helix-turn-helix domain-containing protein [Nocardioides sp. GY 10127]TIC82577.1 helix-turn-helix transcriptional regulator [Nocardioides sp. GY 10127]